MHHQFGRFSVLCTCSAQCLGHVLSKHAVANMSKIKQKGLSSATSSVGLLRKQCVLRLALTICYKSLTNRCFNNLFFLRCPILQSTTRVKPFICTMPMRLDDGWNQIQFNLSDFTRRAYGELLTLGRDASLILVAFQPLLHSRLW